MIYLETGIPVLHTCDTFSFVGGQCGGEEVAEVVVPHGGQASVLNRKIVTVSEKHI